MSEIIKVGDQFYVLATSALADDRTRVLKQGETFAVFDRYGNIHPVGRGEQGLYHEGTRFLSHLEISLDAHRPMLLSSNVHHDNMLFSADMTNVDITADGSKLTPRGWLHLFRQKFLWNGVCHERFRILNHGMAGLDVGFSIMFEADFADIFHVRGMTRRHTGEFIPPQVVDGGARVGYRGVDGVERTLHVECSPRPDEMKGNLAIYKLRLKPQESRELWCAFRCEVGGRMDAATGYGQALEEVEKRVAAEFEGDCTVTTSNKQFNDLLERSRADLHLLVTNTQLGPYPYAGIPWFSTVFGRDGIITATEALWLNPGIARGVLRYLADTQAREDDPEKDAEPGKILHEYRSGEMAAAGEIPFGRYYGSADATPLFVMLAGLYFQYTGDRRTVEDIWPNIIAAIEWMDEYGDLDGDGFIEYRRRSKMGLANQGWKDSFDSISHADGSDAEGPIALCEVQGYAYAARRNAAALAGVLGENRLAETLRRQARELKTAFEKAFWVPQFGTYAIALDGRKRQCRISSSNAGHALFTGIASPAMARKTARTLMDEALFSGWGVRTLSSSEVRYNPMSYHNGSVWPHDNALIAAGLSRYGMKEHACRIFTGLYETALALEQKRLPELFCGFHRRQGQGPTLYPVACSPQAWAAAAVFMLLQSCLGMSASAPNSIRFDSPMLPEWLDDVRIENLKVGGAAVDLLFQRSGADVGVTVIKRTGNIEIIVVK